LSRRLDGISNPSAHAIELAGGQSALRGDFIAISRETARVFDSYVAPGAIGGDPRDDVTDYVRTRDFKLTTNFIPVRPLRVVSSVADSFSYACCSV
jgi:hypothetical protein